MGTRLYPVKNTHFEVLVPGVFDKHRVLAIGDSQWTLPRSCFRYPQRVVYVGAAENCVTESEAKQKLNDDPDCYICSFKVAENGGVFGFY